MSAGQAPPAFCLGQGGGNSRGRRESKERESRTGSTPLALATLTIKPVNFGLALGHARAQTGLTARPGSAQGDREKERLPEGRRPGSGSRHPDAATQERHFSHSSQSLFSVLSDQQADHLFPSSTFIYRNQKLEVGGRTSKKTSSLSWTQTSFSAVRNTWAASGRNGAKTHGLEP